VFTSHSGAGLGEWFVQSSPTSNCDPEDEVWEFPPDSIVGSEVSRFEGKDFLLAVAPSGF